MKRLAFLLFVGLVIVVPTHVLYSQAEAEEEELHYITVTTFKVPLGEVGQQVGMWIDSVMVPLARLNPNVFSYRVGRHYWGSSAGDYVIITEWASWEAIAAPCGEPCDTWTAETEPEEGTPRAEMWDKIYAMFMKYYSGHRDEIYAVPMSRAK
jgi:hypothetical protein